MSEMPKAYEFRGTEERLYDWWESNGWFKPEIRPADAETFVISIPPPNVTGELHLGHALVVALEDLMIRKARMQGLAALWVPGTDHAGIATQLQVEKMIKREEGLSREEIGREAFVQRVWDWKEKYGSEITNQLRRMGASCDWDRERFTMDDGLSAAVREAFVRMYRLGLIYQAEYLVNWSPGLQTAVSDLEVEYGDEPGHLYYFNYPVLGGGNLPVATTRPETILGDTAVAVHPDDERYKQFIGKSAIVPILNREIPIIADDYVDISFGTGALKVTPGHDPNDFEIGQRHELPIINVMNKDATMSASAGKYAGMDRFECREELWQDMEAAKLTLRKEDYVISVPRSQRGGEIIEPLVSRQWFANAEPMAKLALAAVKSGRIKIVPERFVKVWDNWLTNIHPWVISRQLWWGHRIPVWHCESCGHFTVTTVDPSECESCGGTKIEQDPDVLDTWFSSGLWPFSTLGWPEQTEDLARFYPTDVMETGYDILFFWVARMVMTGALFTNEVPFHTVYLHGLVRDEVGRKMSKTTGTVIDPLEIADVYGTDALRFTLLTGGSPGNDLNLSMAKVASNRNFANKIWNMARYIIQSLENIPPGEVRNKESKPQYTLADKWILTRLQELSRNVNRLFDGYLYGEAGRQIHDFLWGDFADWYLELAKVQFRNGGIASWTSSSVLFHVLDTCLRLLHPFMPYITEETWQHLRAAYQKADSGILPDSGWPEALILAEWPEAGDDPDDWFIDEALEFERIRELIKGIRGQRSDHSVPPSRLLPATIIAGEKSGIVTSQKQIIAFLARLDAESLIIVDKGVAPVDSVMVSEGDITAYLPLADLIDLDKERVRLTSEIQELDVQIKRISKLLESEFSQKAPANVVDRERDKLERYNSSRVELAERLEQL